MNAPDSIAPVSPAPPKILVVEDDPSYGELLRYQLERDGYLPEVVCNGEDALRRLYEIEPAVVLLDVMLPGRDGREILGEIHASEPDIPVVMMTAASSVELAVECMKMGSYDFLIKPFDFERLKSILRNALQFRELRLRVRNLEGELVQRHGFDQILAHSPIMRVVVQQARRAATSDSDVLVLGESGTGKEVMARAIHFNSARRKGPFVAINCGAIPEGLMESELFGHEKGSFTGASSRRIGCFEQANTGTLFLDEIGEMRPDMQVRLLRALEQREVRRVGSDRTIKVNVRVISATNQDIKARIRDQTFRTDLYYRLAILVLALPPLRERIEDIGPLAQFFLREVQKEGLTRATTLGAEAVEVLLKYRWPGNVRELRNAIERALVFEDSSEVTVGSLPPDIIRHAFGQAAVPAPRIFETQRFKAVGAESQPPAVSELQQVSGRHREHPPSGDSTRLLQPIVGNSSRRGTALMPDGNPYPPAMPPPEGDEIRTMDVEEKNIILRALSITCGNISDAARRLGLHRSTLHRKMARYGLATEEELQES